MKLNKIGDFAHWIIKGVHRSRLDEKHATVPLSLDRDRNIIWEYVKSHDCKNILEIGIGSGGNARKILSLVGNGCNYFAFDILDNPESQRAFLELKDEKNIHWYIGDSKETLPRAVNELPKMDIAFIDGGHDKKTVENDWDFVKRLMHDGSVCFFHDYELLGVWRVVRQIGRDKFSVEIISSDAGTLFARVETR